MAVRAHITHGMSAHKKGAASSKLTAPLSQVCAPRSLCSRAYCRYFARVRSAYAAEIAEQASSAMSESVSASLLRRWM
jgi:hypothetical protein